MRKGINGVDRILTKAEYDGLREMVLKGARLELSGNLAAYVVAGSATHVTVEGDGSGHVGGDELVPAERHLLGTDVEFDVHETADVDLTGATIVAGDLATMRVSPGLSLPILGDVKIRPPSRPL